MAVLISVHWACQEVGWVATEPETGLAVVEAAFAVVLVEMGGSLSPDQV